MSCCHHGSVPQEARPGTARVLVTELSGSGHINPTPATKPCEDSEAAVELYLSPEKLESLCGTRDLSHLTSLEICVDTQENTLANFGAYLPKLVQLKMNNSTIMSVRDLGTTLSHLQVLWMSRCSLQDLDGISTFSSLKELYVAYNKVSDLSQVGMLMNLQLLDLEGNDVDDLVQIQYLGLCGKLQTLTLEGNPVCVHPNPTAIQTADYSYRAAVRELVPQLRYLDDLRVEEDRLSCISTMGEDWAILRNSIRDVNSYQAATKDGNGRQRMSLQQTWLCKAPCFQPLLRLAPLVSRLQTPHWLQTRVSDRAWSSFPSWIQTWICRLRSSDSGSRNQHPDAWSWQDPVLWKPSPGYSSKKRKVEDCTHQVYFHPRDLPIHVPEHTYDFEEHDVRERVDVFAELRAWREQHSSRLQAIETERLPQVLAIQHSDEGEDDDEEEAFGGVRNDSSDEEHRAEKHGESLDSPDSSFQSLSPDLHHREALSPEVSRLSLSPDTRLCPSPPLSGAPTANRKPPGIRARRLRLSQTNSEHSPDFSRVGRSPGTGTTAGDTDLTLQRVPQWTRTDVPLLPLPAHIPRPPPTSALGKELMGSSTEMDLSSTQSGSKHLLTPQMSKVLDRPAITRPHTARAALQKHHQHHIHQPCRGSSQPD